VQGREALRPGALFGGITYCGSTLVSPRAQLLSCGSPRRFAIDGLSIAAPASAPLQSMTAAASPPISPLEEVGVSSAEAGASAADDEAPKNPACEPLSARAIEPRRAASPTARNDPPWTSRSHAGRSPTAATRRPSGLRRAPPGGVVA